MNERNFQLRVLEGFEDATISAAAWNELLKRSSTDVIFMTWQWQKVWWEVFGRGKLLLISAEQNNKTVTIAPLFADEGMIFFIGSGGSDYLDFIGDISEGNILEQMLSLAKEQVPGFLGFRFYHVPDGSNTGSILRNVSKQTGWKFYDEGELPAPLFELTKYPSQALAATTKKSLLRHENWFKKNGDLQVKHLKQTSAIVPLLNIFFEQHITRWSQTQYPSLFQDSMQKLFYNRLCEALSETGWLRFTYVKWNDEYAAFHFGFNYNGNFLWYKPTYEIAFAKHSPGEVLLRQLLLHAIDGGADIFDFGLGDEAFKLRFSTNTRLVRTWGLYPVQDQL